MKTKPLKHSKAARTPRAPSPDRRLEVLAKAVVQLQGRTFDMVSVVTAMQSELRAAIARKPNEVLARLVYQLGGARQELADVQDQLRANTEAVHRLIARMEQAPTARASKEKAA
jgi:hypothetical protein